MSVRGVERPYKDDDVEQLFGRILASANDPHALGSLVYELQFRADVAPEIKGAVVRHLNTVAVGQDGEFVRPDAPDWEFPSVNMYERRRRKARKVGKDWREVGLLRLSGYAVGKKGRGRDERRRVLNWVFLKDDLRDIDDEEYAEEWGAPRSSERLRKMAYSIVTFASNAGSRSEDYSTAIAHWKEDLTYLKNQFYERWHDWPWPKVDVKGT